MKMRFLIVILSFLYTQIALAQNEKKLNIKGSATAQLRYYGASNNFGSRPPWVYNVRAQPVLYYGKWKIPTRIVVGNYQARFRDFNRYGIAPERKDLKLYIGHSTLNWLPFVINSRPILGAGLEFTPSKWITGVFVGQINRSSVRDTFQNRIFAPAFSRQMAAVQFGYGDEQNQLVFNYLTATDRENSLDPASAIGIRPESNQVLGINGLKSLGNLTFNGNIAFSALTKNKLSTAQEFVNPGIARIPSIFNKVNASTGYSAAYGAEISYAVQSKKSDSLKKSPALIQLIYDRIEPGYESMGLYFLVNDIERIRGGFKWKDKSQKFDFQANAGYEHNDLLNSQFLRNKRIIGGLVINYLPGQNWNHTLVLQNYSVRLLAETISLEDSLIINQINRVYSYTGSGRFRKDRNSPKWYFSGGIQNGKNIVAGTSANYISHTYLSARYQPTKENKVWLISPGYGIHRYMIAKTPTTRHLPTVSFDRKMRANKISFKYETGTMITWFNKKYINTVLRNLMVFNYIFNPKNQLSANLLFQRTFQKSAGFMEIQFDIRYVMRF